MPMAGLGAGYVEFAQQDQQRALQQAALQRLMMENAAAQNQQQARGPAFEALARLLGPQAAPGGGIPPPPPGSPQGGPQAPPPGMNMAPPQPQAGPPPGAMPPPQMGPQMPPPPMAGGAGGPPSPMMRTGMSAGAPAPIPPFRPMPGPPPGAAQPGAPGQIAPPPTAAPQPAPEAVAQPNPLNLQKIVTDLKQSGVPPAKAMDVLDSLSPIMNAQNKSELEMFKATTRAQEAAIHSYRAVIEEYKAQKGMEIKQQEADRRERQGDARNEIMRKRAEASIGGSGNLKGKIDLIYPKDAQGKVDQTQPPIGTRATTKTGKIVYLDADGLQTTAAALAGGTASEDKASRVGVTNVVRQNIVRAGVTNSLRLLDEIEKEYPKDNTSVFFGTHGENPLTKGAYGMGRSAIGSKARQVDAKWAGFIDEAIPVFTGGLRGSDAFRRFLIEQAPGPGDDPASRAVKVKTIRDNISGTSKAFFNKFASDPSMWAPGIKPEEVEEAKQGAGAPAKPKAATGGAPTPGTVESGYKFKGGDPGKRENWEPVGAMQGVRG